MRELIELDLDELTAIHNRLADKYDFGGLVARFKRRDTAIKKIMSFLRYSEDKVILILDHDCVKRGTSAERCFTYWADGTLASDYVEMCVEAGFKKYAAQHDLRNCSKRREIQLV